MNGWTTERRQRQALLIQQWQPWQHSTGARTLAGKVKVSRNAYKGGFRLQLKELNQLLREQKLALKNNT